jgi:hypothetical protein
VVLLLVLVVVKLRARNAAEEDRAAAVGSSYP